MLGEDVEKVGLDDFQNNLAYNGDIQPTQPSTDTGWTFEIIGDSEIIQNTQKTYSVRIWHNSIEDTSPTQTVIWELENSNPSIAYLVEGSVVVNRNVTINAVDGINYITLKATLSVDNTKVQRKQITIKGLF
jgi:hypothetical protein